MSKITEVEVEVRHSGFVWVTVNRLHGDNKHQSKWWIAYTEPRRTELLQWGRKLQDIYFHRMEKTNHDK